MEKFAIFMIFLGPLVFFHELGHFLFARFFGVKVEVFSIGFGPKLLKFKRGDTEYTLSLIPLGGYVKMFGDNPFDETKLTPEEEAVAGVVLYRIGVSISVNPSSYKAIRVFFMASDLIDNKS